MLMPPNVQRMLAKDPPRRSLPGDIKHVVILMQENRSFDHYFGTLAGVRGFGDPDALKLSDGKSVFYQPDAENPEGYMLPFHLNPAASSAQKIPSTSHAWAVQHEAWNGGQDGPMAAGPSQGGRRQCALCAWAITSGKTFRSSSRWRRPLPLRRVSLLGYGPDLSKPHVSDDRHDRPGWNGRRPNHQKSAPAGGYTWTTYPERLEQAGISWKVYQQTRQLRLQYAAELQGVPAGATGSPLHSKGMMRGPEGQFEYDAMNDKLPAVSWIMPTSFQSEHPDYMPADGAAFVASKIDAIAANPDVWAKTAFILNYDENDGIFDHVPPPVAPAGNAARIRRRAADRRQDSAFRASSFRRGPPAAGYAASRSTTRRCFNFWRSLLACVNRTSPIGAGRPLATSTSAFRFDHAEKKPPLLPETSGQLSLAKYGSIHLPEPALPGSDQQPPMQEKGHRHRVAKNES